MCYLTLHVILISIVTAIIHVLYWLLTDKDVYRTDREVDKYKSSDSHSLKQLEDILTTYVMYNVDLGKYIVRMHVRMNESHLLTMPCMHKAMCL